MTKRRARLYLLLLFMTALGLSTGFVLMALKDNLSYFRTPSEVASGHYPESGHDRAFRLGGLVEQGSLTHDGPAIRFRVTDLKQSVTITYNGVVPDLFREGQGVVAEGKMAGDTFAAQLLVAKHDEKYQPPEVMRALDGAKAEDRLLPLRQ